MKGKQFTLLLLLSFLSITCFGQVSLHGKISDARTKEPLINASVFCQNTTYGTFTDQLGEFSLTLNPGGYNLIISYTGYRPQSIPITESTGPLLIKLEKETIQLGEVVVKAKTNFVEDGWGNYGSFFIKNFIGTTPNAENCHILNPDVLKFYFFAAHNKLKVFETGPLTLKNDALGYTLSYQLDSFVLFFNEELCYYQGNCLFTEMEGSDKEKKMWKENRKQVFYGSVLHFMRSYYDGTLLKNGWNIGLQNKEDMNIFDRATNPYDTMYYRKSKNKTQIEIFYPRRIKITYLKKAPDPAYLEMFNLSKKINTQSSAADMKDGIIIKENGFYYEPMSWITYNYWSWKNVADQLPYDYVPD